MSGTIPGLIPETPPTTPRAELRNPAAAAAPASFLDAWVQGSFTVRSLEDRQARIAAFGSFSPPAVDGYNPFADPERLRGYEDSLHLVRDSQSPAETAHILHRVDELRARARRVEQTMGWFPRTLAGLLTPESLVTLPFGGGPARAVTGMGQVVELAARGAIVGGAQAGLIANLDSVDLPTGLQSGTEDVAMSALFGAALGGLAGSVSRRSLDAAARRHLDAHAAAEGAAPAPRAAGETDAPLEFHDGQRWRSAPLYSNPFDPALYREHLLDPAMEAIGRLRRRATAGAGEGSAEPPPGAPPDARATPAPVYENPTEAVRFAPGGGYRTMGDGLGQLPMYGLINNRIPGELGDAVAATASDLVQLPGSLMEGNARGLPSRADSVEARAKQASFLYVEADRFQREAYYAHMGWDPEDAGPLRSRVANLAQRLPEALGGGVPAGRMTFDEFDRAVALATAEAGQHADPNVAAAAARWREFYARFEEEGARQGVLLTPRHRDLARAALDREAAGRRARLAEVDAEIRAAPGGEARIRWEEVRTRMRAAQDELALRRERLDEARPMTEAYVTHRWLRGRIAEDREGLVDVIGRHWARMKGTEGWAAPFVRAELAVSHLLREGPADALARVLARHAREGGAERAAAEAAAGAAAGPIREYVARIGPSRLDTELRSLLGRPNPDIPMPELHGLIRKALEAAGVETGDLQRLVREIAGGDGGPVADWHDAARPGSAKARTIDVPTRDLAPWLDLNQSAGAAEYARRMGTAIEMSRKMGDPSMLGRLERMEVDLLRAVGRGETTMEEAARALENARVLRDKLLGTYAIPADPDAWSVRGVRALTNAAVVTQMGSALLANIMDVGRLVQYRGMRELLGDMMDAAASNHRSWRLGGDEAAKAGAALELELLTRTRAIADLTDAGGDRLWAERALDAGAKHMQVLNLVAPWTERLQRFAGAIVQSDLIGLSVARAEGTITAKQLRQLAGMGVGEAEAARIAEAWRAAGAERHGRLFLANTDAWADAELRSQFRANIASALDSVVTKPGIGDRPNFMSAPLWQTVLLYRGFTMAATQRILMSGLQQRDARVLSGLAASTAIAWLINGPAGGQHDPHPIRSPERLFDAIERGGALGILADLNKTVETLSGNGIGLRPLLGLQAPTYVRDPSWAQQVGAVAGAAPSPWLNLGWALTSREADGNDVARSLRRTLPFNNLLYTDWLFSAAAREAGSAAVGR